MHKICCRCELDKSLFEFSRNSNSKDGKMSFCKDCDAKRQHYTRKEVPNINLSNEQLAYLAGLLDGEGHIGLCKSRRKSGPFVGNNRVHVIMRIGITHKAIYDIQAEYDIGKLHINKVKKANHKECITWNITSKNAKNLLPKLIPFLKIKKQQAELLVEYYKLARTRDQNYRDSVITIYNKLKKLNQRGIHNGD